MAVSGEAIAVGTAGVVLLWSALTGKGILKTLQGVIQGKPPGKIPSLAAGSVVAGSVNSSLITNLPGTNQGPPPPPGNDAANQALGKLMAGAYGWGSGPEWDALNNIVEAESGWNADIVNPTSTASGIAQNISGWSADYQPGNARQQIAWLLAYIHTRYGDPIAAWQFHLANGWY